MPEGHRIVGAEWDFLGNCMRLFVEGPDLPEVSVGEKVPYITPEITVEDDPDTPGRKYTWNWKL
jgi:hypothetical protein